MVEIDGAMGEGGGQVLRTALTLSLVTGKPLHVRNIRAARRKPGLGRQHLTAVIAVAEICRAQTTGVELGSTEISFVPGEVRSGNYDFSVGSAGSTTLVLQTVLLPLLLAPGPSIIRLEGGTHNPLAPPADFVKKTFLPLLTRMGGRVRLKLERAGFYPRGGGRIAVAIDPAPTLNGLHLLDRGDVRRITARSLVANLPRHVGERELEVARKRLRLPREALYVEELREARGPGNALLIEVESAHVTEVFASFGEKGLKAEKVAQWACNQTLRYLKAEVPVGENLADQLLLPMALARAGSMRTLSLTSHAQTNIEVIRKFLEVAIDVLETGPDACVVRIGPETLELDKSPCV